MENSEKLDQIFQVFQTNKNLNDLNLQKRDIIDFIENYEFLMNDDIDPEIIISYLKEYFDYLQNKYQDLSQKIIKNTQESQKQIIESKNLLKENKQELKNDTYNSNNQQQQNNYQIKQQNQTPQIKGNLGYDIMTFREQFFRINQQNQYFKLLKFIYETLHNIENDVENFSKRQDLNITSNSKLGTDFLVQILNKHLNFNYFYQEENDINKNENQEKQTLSFFLFQDNIQELQKVLRIIKKDFTNDIRTFKNKNTNFQYLDEIKKIQQIEEPQNFKQNSNQQMELEQTQQQLQQPHQQQIQEQQPLQEQQRKENNELEIISSDDDDEQDRVKLQLKAQKRRQQQQLLNQYSDNQNQQQDFGTVQDQLRAYRQQMKGQQLNQRKFNNQVYTIQDLENKQQDQFIDQKKQELNQQGSGGFQKGQVISMQDIQNASDRENQEKYGKEALKYSNIFRQKQKLNNLEWNKELYFIALKHSKDMAEGKVPFGHQGFNKRAREVPFQTNAFCENVAYSTMTSNLSNDIVNGWINSPGHRKNLVSRANICGIAAYKSQDGRWFFTQLIAYKS